jgi:hypothetical protein
MKKMGVFSFFFALCVSAGFPLYAQEAAPPPITGVAGVEPFVSRFKAAVRGPQIKLTWRDSFDPLVDYIIYRHTREITPENFKDATQVARVERGQEMYVDAPPRQGEFFYAVLAVTPDGTLHNVLIPFRNKTTKGIMVDTTLPEDELTAEVSRITARPEQDRIIINFEVSRADRDLMLFSSTSPLLSSAQLIATREAIRVKGAENQFIDYPVPGIPYYYALVDEHLLTRGKITLEAGRNATRQPAEIPLPAETPPSVTIGEALPGSPDSRLTPLPYYILESKISANESLHQPVSAHIPARRRLSPAAEKAIADIIARIAPAHEPPPRRRPSLRQQTTSTRNHRKRLFPTRHSLSQGRPTPRGHRPRVLCTTHRDTRGATPSATLSRGRSASPPLSGQRHKVPSVHVEVYIQMRK